MPITITHTQTRSVVPGPLYVVEDEVTASSGIAPEVFVFTMEDSYNRIATVDDMLSLQPTKAAAIAAGDDYYRQSDVTRSFQSLSDADSFAIAITDRLKLLVVDYESATEAFIGTTTETLSS